MAGYRLIMWEKTFLLLLHTVEAVVAAQCRQGATFSEAVVAPAVESSSILRVPGVTSLPQCVAACCDLPGYDLAWLFEGRCYVLSCQQRENCQPRQRPGSDSFLAFLRRTLPQPLVLQSLVRGEPYPARWRLLPGSSESPEDLDALKDLALFNGPQQDLDAEHSKGRPGSEVEVTTHQLPFKEKDRLNQSGVSTEGNVSQGDEDKTWRPTQPMTTTERSTGSMSHLKLQEPTTVFSQHHLVRSSVPSTALPLWTISSSIQPAAEQPPTTSPGNAEVQTLPTITPKVSSEPTTDIRVSNRGPVAIVGPDRKLLFPVSSLSLDGSGSTDNQGIVSYHWEVVSGPPGLKLEGADQAVATATGLRVGRYTFTLTVYDQQGAADSASLTVRVHEAPSLPPVAHASGSHTLCLPNSSLVLQGSVTDGDQTQVHYLWVRDSQSPAAGDVLYGSETQASLYLANLVEGTYLFQLRVTDAQGRSSTATATVEVRPELGGADEVELEMLVSVSRISLAQRDTVVRQLAALLLVLDSDIQVRGLQGHSHLSTVLRFLVLGPSGPISGSKLVGLLRNQLLREKSDYLLFRVLRVDTVLCLLHCTGRGQCDPVTKECACDPFWTENPIRRYLGDGESNCDWRVLYVILTSFMLMVLILSLSWTFICCFKRRRQTRVRKKTRYTILDNMDEQERVELRPKFSIKHRSTEHNSSLMMSESEQDSDQDTIFSRDRPVRSRNRITAHATRNGNAFG